VRSAFSEIVPDHETTYKRRAPPVHELFTDLQRATWSRRGGSGPPHRRPDSNPAVVDAVGPAHGGEFTAAPVGTQLLRS
jgi:hypothetical protein